MQIHVFEFNVFGENTYIAYDEPSMEAAIIDPGMMNDRERAVIKKFIDDKGLKMKWLLNTHLHVDHVAGDLWVEETFHLPISASNDDIVLAERVAEQARMFHLSVKVPDRIEIGNPIADGDVIPLGTDSFKVLAVPGHSPGSIAFYSEKSNVVFTGDALFRGSIGRTDLPGGNYGQLIGSITDKLLSLPDNTLVLPGHGPSTTIGEEKRSNPYL